MEGNLLKRHDLKITPTSKHKLPNRNKDRKRAGNNPSPVACLKVKA
jgi:hypothetical protein